MNASNDVLLGAFMERANKFGFVWNPLMAEKFLLPLYEEYEEKRGLYYFIHNEYRPEKHPGKHYALQHLFRPHGVEPGTREHDKYLAFTNSLDSRTNSRMVFRATRNIWHRYPEMFTEEAYLRLTPEDIAEALRSVRYTFPGQGSERWIAFAKTLYENLDGDPLNIYRIDGAGDIDELIRLKGKRKKLNPHFLNGKGPKLLSLLAIMYEEIGRIPPFPRSFPVDLHVQRILTALGIVSWNEDLDVDTTELAEFIRFHLVQFCNWHHLSAVYLSHALWFKGNEICQRCHEWRAKKPLRLAQICLMSRMGCTGPKYHTGTYGPERTWGTKALLDNRVPGADGFQLVRFEYKEPRRKPKESIEKKIDSIKKDIPCSDSFVLEGEDFED